MKKLYQGDYNYQGEVKTLFCWAMSKAQAHALFVKRLSMIYGRHINHIAAYFNGSKNNYEIKEAPHPES